MQPDISITNLHKKTRTPTSERSCFKKENFEFLSKKWREKGVISGFFVPLWTILKLINNNYY